VGDVVKTLRDKQLFDNTLIIFTSDNGYYLGDFGLADKWFMHEPSIRLPLVIYDPRLPAEKRNRHITDWALNIDIAPTILGAAQITPPATMQGLDLLAASNAQKLADRREFYYEHSFKHPGIPFTEGVRGDRFKYARYEQEDVVVEQLFDLVADPHEEHDLAASPEQRETLNKLRARLADWRKEVE
jgi:arylsulfatase A-like enzyme